MEPTDCDRQEAKRIRDAIERTGSYGPIDAVDPHDGSVEAKAEDIIARAILAARTPAKGHIIDDTGSVYHLWSVIRSGLNYCRDDICHMAMAKSNEAWSAYLDSIAQTIASYVSGPIRKQINDAEAALAAKEPPCKQN